MNNIVDIFKDQLQDEEDLEDGAANKNAKISLEKLNGHMLVQEVSFLEA
jgi:hypothetical protein